MQKKPWLSILKEWNWKWELEEVVCSRNRMMGERDREREFGSGMV